MIIVDHGSGYMTLYGNAEIKTPGDWVEGGEPVALAGNSGGQSERIYFEVRDQAKL